MKHLKPSAKRGFALISALLILLVITMLALSMFRGFGMQEKMAGNTREKQRAFQAAQTALQYGEWWLGAGNGNTGTTCSGVVDASVLSQMRVCSAALATPTTLPWPIRADYLPAAPAAMGISASGGLNSTGTDMNYFAKPGLYVSYLGLNPTGDAALYQVTAFGYGGGANADGSTASTSAVVQSTYAISSSVKPLDHP
jgi:type IV pilus assembly protein PilX